MRTDEFAALFSLLWIAMMWRASYELSKPEPNPPKQVSLLYEKKPKLVSNQTTLNQKQREWANKAVKRYAEAQGKKWCNWNEAMYDPE